MASSDWEVLVNSNISHSLVDTLGLVGMDQNYCWNVRTTTSPGKFAVRNITVGEHKNGDLVTNLKVRCLVRKTHNDAMPFIFLRGGNAGNTAAYKLALRGDNKLALYRENLDGTFSTTAIAISTDTFAINTTHHFEFLTYSQPNHDTFIEAYVGDMNQDPYQQEQWTPVFKTMIFYSDTPILAGWCGFGHYSATVNANSYFDLYEVYEEQV
jgi:hypothetical protein